MTAAAERLSEDDLAPLAKRAHLAARAGKVSEARKLIRDLESSGLQSDTLFGGIGMLHYLTGDARSAVAWLQKAETLTPEAELAFAAALTALGEKRLAAGIHHRAIGRVQALELGAEDMIDGEHLSQYVLPAMAARNWGPHMRMLAAGKLAEYYTDLKRRAAQMPDNAPGAAQLRLRSGRRVPRWEGEAVRHLAVLFKDGYGDVFCFGRYLGEIRRRCEALTVVAHPPVLSLVQDAVAGVAWVSYAETTRVLEACDAYVDEWALPWWGGGTAIAAKWLSVDPEKVARWSWPAGSLHVGLAWGGSNWNQADSLRSIPAYMLGGLLKAEGVTWHSLQVGPKARDCPPEIIDHAHELKSFRDTAELMCALDLVISVDTAVANLAGALGLPVWALIERHNDFRWGLEGESSAWFPTARVFRQRSSGGWARVLRSVRSALNALPSNDIEKKRSIDEWLKTPVPA